jgi:outer membrane protein OmpA-like peptidoglycan-associated protein
VSERKNGRWQKPVRLNNHVNRPGSDSRHPALTPGGDTLYFASNRPGGLGLNDIWMSVKTGGDWREPSNLGPGVNTAENDVSPFYYAREKQLFFASDGRMGMGGLDLYFLNMAAGATAPVAVNLGRPFNSSRDDAFLVLGREKGFLASNRFSNQGDFDIHTFDINSRQSDLIALDKTDELRRPDLAYLADFQFEYLTDEDKLLLDRIIGKREADRLHGTDLPLEEREQYFYEHLSSEEKNRLARMARALAARRDSAALVAQDRHHFEMAASEGYRNQVKRVAEAYRKAIADGSVPVLTDDKFLYDSLAHEERNRFHRQVAGALSKRLGTDESRLAAETYAYEQLPPEDKNRLARMAAERFAAKLNQYDEQFREADKFYYEHLSPEEKARLDRLMAARKSQLGDNMDLSSLSSEDKMFYEQLPSEARERLNRMAAARYASTLNATDERFSEADKFYYENLSAEEKSRLDRLVTARVTGNRLALDGAGLSESDQFYYTQLSSEEKDRLERMAAARRAAKLNGTDEAFSQADKFYYENLSPEEKNRLDRLLAARNAASRQQADNSELVTESGFSFERLPSEADQQKRSPAQRKTKMLPLADASAPGTGWNNVLSQLDASKMGGYKEVKLTGRLVDAQLGKPVGGVSLQLTEGQDDVITTTTTNPDGTFQYLNLPVAKQLRIRIETATSSLTDQQMLYVQNLALTAYRDATRPVSFSPAYFAFDSHVLSKRAIRTLDSLVAFYKKHPDSQIELNAFADAAGTEEYNLRLSRQRGAAVQKYLLGKGVPPGGIVMYARGEVKSAKPAQRNPAFRKVTVSIQRSDAHLNTAETFVVLPDTDLKTIARKTGVAIEKLRQLNGFKTDIVEAYRPIRVK